MTYAFHFTASSRQPLLVALICIAFYGVSIHTKAQNKFSLTPWPVNSSLSQSTIISTVVAEDGTLWIATLDGINRFDGNELFEYRAYKAGAGFIESSSILDILQGENGEIYVATRDAGVLVYDRLSNSFFSYKTSDGVHIQNGRVSAAFLDRRGNIWIGYEDGSISRVIPRIDDVKNYRIFSHSRISSFTESRSGEIFVATAAGEMARFGARNSRPTNIRITERCSSQLLNLIVIAAIGEDELWIGTRGHGLYSINIEDLTCSPIDLPIENSTGSKNANVYQILDEPGKELTWVASDQGLYSIRHQHPVDRFHTGNTLLSDNEVSSITFGEDGVYWIGTFSGLNYIIPTNFDVFGEDVDSDLHSIVAIDSSRKQGLWIASYEGLLKFDPKTGNHLALSELHPGIDFTNEKIMSLHFDSNGMWVGYSSSGLEFYSREDKTIESFGTHEERRLSSNSISAILTSSTGQTLVGTYGGGLNIVSNGETSTLPSLAGYRVIMLYETSDKLIWVGTESGLFRLDLRSRKIVSIPVDRSYTSSKSSPLIWSMAESANGDLWFGTMHHGLLHWPIKAQLRIDTSGINSLVWALKSIRAIYSIQVDDSGYIWCSTNRGLVRVDPETQLPYIVSTHHGLHDTEFDFGVSHKDDDGYLYFGGSGGYSRFDPDAVQLDPTPPRVKLTRIELAGDAPMSLATLTKVDHLQLTHKNYLVNFTFTALDFLDPEKNQFRYKLENFDPEWIENGTRNTATYTNLPAGDYVFRAQGANASGIWNREGIALNVTVLPAPWLTWWAFCGYGVVGMTLVWLAVRAYDSYSIERRAVQLASAMHDAENKADDDMQEQLELQDELVQSAYRHNVATLELINDCMSCHGHYLPDDATRAATDENIRRISALAMLENCFYYQSEGLLADLHKYTDMLTAELLKHAPVRQETITTINDVSTTLVPADLASALSLLIFELLDNCIQHAFDYESPANYIHVTLDTKATGMQQGRSYRLTVRDNGIGIPHCLKAGTPETSGLAIVSFVATRVSGTLRISAENGTTVSLDIPPSSTTG